MCLILTKDNPDIHIAEYDEIVFKLVIRNNDKFVTYFQCADVKLNETYESELIKKELKIFFGTVDIGLHSFESYSEIITYLQVFKPLCHICLIKCIIPKGSKYYKGTFNYRLKAIASDKLKYTDEIILEWSPNQGWIKSIKL